MSVRAPLNILLVDDQPAKLMTYETILERLGDNLIKASSAREAFACLLKTDVAVIIVDVCMPELDGLQLVTMLREHPRFERTAVIFVSAIHQSVIDLLRGYETGAVDFVAVPVVPEILRAKVRVFADLYRKTRQLDQLNAELERCFVERTGELQHSAARLLESESRYRFVLESLPIAVYACDAHGQVTFFNEGAAQLWGRSPELGKDLWCGSWRIYRPDGSQLPIDRSPLAVSLREKRAVRDQEIIVERPDGTRRHVMPYPLPILDVSGEVTGAINMLLDITERRQAEERQTLLMAELDHRVKNILANVVAMVRLSTRQVDSIETFVEVLEGRIQAVARAHGLLRDGNWVGANMKDLVEVALQPFRSARAGNIEIRGASLPLAPKVAQLLSLVLHELATNAVKHGALSVAGGCVTVDWTSAAGSSDVRLSWREHGGPPAIEPKKRGFGLTMLDLSATEIGATIELAFTKEGLRCAITGPFAQGEAPARELATGRSERQPPAGLESPPTQVEHARVRILIVEDEPLIALQLQSELEDEGYQVIGPAHNLKRGLELVSTEALDAALVDVSLGAQLSVAIADELLARSIPFAFTTGYSDGHLLPERLRRVPCMNKPYRQENVVELLKRLVEGRNPGTGAGLLVPSRAAS